MLARRSGVTLSEEDIVSLYEGFGLLEQLVAELGPLTDAKVDPALVFTPEVEA